MVGLFAIVTFAVVAGGCGSSGYGGRAQSTSDTKPAATTPAPTAPTPTVTGDGISAEEDLAIHPPPPRDLRVAAATAAGVRLTWTDPEPVTAKHTYGDTIVSYRVHRKAPGELQFVPIATTTAPTYTDPTVESGKSYAYSVVDVRDQGVESGLSEPVEVTVP